MYRSDEVRGIHLEITTRCNARCPMCPRNYSGGKTVEYLPLVELSLADIRRALPEDFVKQLGWLYLCGNYGDALAAKDTLEVLRYLRSVNAGMSLKMFTNGGGRPPDWWRALAGVTTSTTFAIDGLEDTNHLYRRDVVWDKLLANVKAYLGAGGRAEWDYLVFKHNEHQIEEARALSRALGFVKFNVKRTERFLVSGKPAAFKPVLDDEGRQEYVLEMPSDEEQRNPAYASHEKAAAAGETWKEYIRTTPVECKVAREKQLYLSAEGYVFPCCWTAKLYDQAGRKGEAWRWVEKLPGGLADLDAKSRPIREIIDGPLFQQMIPDTWTPGAPGRAESAICMRACGVRSAVRQQRVPEPEPRPAEPERGPKA